MSSRLVLHYDIVSPWSYVAFVTLTRYVKLWNMEMELKPINLGYVMKNAQNKPPLTVPNKGKHMGGEMVRAEQFFGLKLKMPKEFPFNSFPLQCALRVLQDDHPTRLHSATAHFFQRVWSGEEFDLLSVEAVGAELKKWGELSEGQVGEVVKRAGLKETRTLLNEEAKKLVEDGGAFGAPWIVTTRPDGRSVSFFGSDRTEQIAAFLEKPYKGPMADGRPSASKL
ncbi:thioredoxin-like protein [Microstroma glucosiphilum]|uniref:Glutathione S-transferase kappa n=1 Tax=Pseudomicrostroma glucosiphilum TaxID=1684307 RepID=A0A316U2G8_9BASI|nr:thioredoxin-like protein [Pseudomicrostroma glucosiphilum]PWN19529.1 thioredoxin-like protein [Pseudomicrostroma glucosiphilum]